ncbi:hypothetical protein MKJ01_08405 [Chryseobacterium sp. SSA4.19]|uniref:hypothetical protein n=1 Tax=Chryseobacterium sp. SSA4.19 TaxID=2919915 RepID=UPI001F4DC93A|nr:hypothetical protein [Chryseobacterium sp. SSA4.19]MCJ8153772.1 hypothetical protein [Chryseobacterium sp. SSA4.19]
MKRSIILLGSFILTALFPTFICAQSGYKLGIFSAAGVNIYNNRLTNDDAHFRFTSPVTANFGIRLIRQLDEKDHFFAELLYTRKKIEFKYSLSEPAIPFSNQETISQKYDCFSVYAGYRRVYERYTHALFFEASIGADYNTNTVVSASGSGEATEDLSGPIFYQSLINTHLGEKTYTLSGNLGFGIMSGTRNQYEIGAFVNIPFHKIQSETSSLDYTWNYSGREYRHQLRYIGSVYYPSLRLTYYIF